MAAIALENEENLYYGSSNIAGNRSSGLTRNTGSESSTSHIGIKQQAKSGTSFSISKDDAGLRTIYFNDPKNKVQFCSNEISTGKYTATTFLPLFFFEQFRKAFNIFFLLISTIQQIPNVSPTGQFTTLLPLMFILSVAAVKEIIEDYKRHKQDRVTNNRQCLVYSPSRKTFQLKFWTAVEVGDIVQLESDSFFPADLIILSTSEPQGMCYIETANLDGETNLKVRQALKATNSIQTVDNVASTSGRIVCENPNRHLYTFSGYMELKSHNKNIPLGPEQILLRGAKLRNTHSLYGIVVYTGHETKLMKNANKAPLKMSNVDQLANKQIWYLLLLLLVLSLVSTCGSWLWKNKDVKRWYIQTYLGNTFLSTCLSILTFMILYNNIVPISLLVTLEVVKFIQAFFINNDADMFYEENHTGALARTSNLNEELGQVQYIFSDKTGTLTQNKMEFRKCTMAGYKYENNGSPHGFDDPQFIHLLSSSETASIPLKEFVLAMAICHTVIPERESSSSDYGSIKYQGSSPDENALVAAAQNLGCTLTYRTPTHIIIDAWGQVEKFAVLNVLDFNSTRKRMSVIIEQEDGRIVLYCKGADNVIYQRLTDNPPQQFTDVTLDHLEDFAVEGLRTLCFARTYIEPEEYEHWNNNVFYPASTDVVDREKKLDLAYEDIEQNLHLLGASAIEDELQDGVPDTIATLSKANIKIWVLTGDKVETAINIASSCNLITAGMEKIIMQSSKLEETSSTLKRFSTKLNRGSSVSQKEYALVVSGACLLHCLHKTVYRIFLDVALSCKAVVCCRVSPLQKAEVVELVKTNCKAITLAIGDGANDVSMIQAAHVGVGISGFEGLQAANSSDYSIAQFAYLKQLLLVHGAWNYDRLTKCILFSFYKNICLYLMQLWFLFFNGFSGQILFDPWTIAMYNLAFTSLPPFTLGLFERLCSKKNMMECPELYTMSQNALRFNTNTFWKMFANATTHSLILFFLPALSFNHDVFKSDGKTGGYLYFGNFVYSYVIVTVCFKAGMETGTWTMFTFLSVFGSITMWFAVLIIYSILYPTFQFASKMSGQGGNVLNTPLFWFGLLLCPIVTLFCDLIWKVFRRKYMGTIADRVRDKERASLLAGCGKTVKQKLSQSKLDKQPFDKKVRASIDTSKYIHGYAFSQEEGGIVSQEQIIRKYNTTSRS